MFNVISAAQRNLSVRALATFGLALLLLLESAGSLAPLQVVAAATDQPGQFHYFEQTGHSVSGALYRFYNRTGGEERHGYPLSELINTKGKYQQFFERSVLEFDPNYRGSQSEVTQTPLGVLEAAGRNFPTVTPFVTTSDHWFFPETGHSLSLGFLEFWRNHGDRASLGLPLSEEIEEAQSDNLKLTVQYFEFARLEYHADSKTIQLGLLGRKRANDQLDPASLAPIARAILEQPRAVRVPSLMFHYVRQVDARKDPLGFGLSVTPENFVKYADWLQQNGYNTVTVAQINDYLRYGIPLPNKPVNLRFDDGHSDQLFAYQEMKKRGQTATFFVITQRLELLPTQWQQIDADGFEVAAHTRTHPDLRGTRDLEGEITGSKRDLETILGHPVRSFAYPYGKYGPTILQIVRDSGFEMAVTTNGGYGWTGDNYYTEPTLSVTGNDSLESFASKVQTAPRASLVNATLAPDNTPAGKTGLPASAKTTAKAGSNAATPKSSPNPAAKTTAAPKLTPEAKASPTSRK